MAGDPIKGFFQKARFTDRDYHGDSRRNSIGRPYQ